MVLIITMFYQYFSLDTQLNDSKYCYVLLAIQLNLSYLLTHI